MKTPTTFSCGGPVTRPRVTFAFGELGPGLVSTRTFTLSRGTWTLFCSLPGHYEAGMHVNLIVN